MSQPAISAGLASRPMPSGLRAVASGLPAWDFGAAEMIPPPAAASASTPMPRAASLRNLDILNLAVLVQMPGLDAVVVIDRVRPAQPAQLRLARLHVAALIHGTRLQQQLAAVPVELVVEARERLVPGRAVELGAAPVAPAIERNVDARDLAAAGPG